MARSVIDSRNGVIALQRLAQAAGEGLDQAFGDLLRGAILEQGLFPRDGDVDPADPEVDSLVGVVAYDFTPCPAALQRIAGLKGAHPRLPILVIGRSNDDAARVAAFEAGADNFLPANHDRKELAIKIRRLASMRDPHPPTIAFDDLQIWPSTNVVMRGGVPIKLSGKEMRVLLCLAAAAPNAVDRATLLREVFGLDFDPGTNNVEVHVHRLRQKIDKGHAVRLINTERGIGYLLGSAGADGQKNSRQG